MNLYVVGFWLLSCAAVFANGSISWEEVAAKIPQPTRQFIQQTLQVSEAGAGLRLGRHTGSLSGSRIGPYEFDASSKVNAAKFKLVVETEVEFRDRNGRVIDMVNAPDGAKITETFSRINLKPAAQVADPEAVQAVRDVYNEVQGLSLAPTNFSFDETQSLKIEKSADKVRRAVLVSASDHGASTVEVYFDSNQRLRFIFIVESHWKFIAENKTRDFGSEYRLYFDTSGNLVESLKKSFAGSGDTEFNQAKAAASNQKNPLLGPQSNSIQQQAKALLRVTNSSQAEQRSLTFLEAVTGLRQ